MDDYSTVDVSIVDWLSPCDEEGERAQREGQREEEIDGKVR